MRDCQGKQILLERAGVRLACRDYGGDGPAVVLVHGLAGHAGEWSDTAAWLTRDHRVVALDTRGHGNSERNPADVSPAAHVADVGHAIEALGLTPTVLVGQSLGGLMAMLTAARHRELVRALVIVEATLGSPGQRGDGNDEAREVRRSLERWPVPFASLDSAVEFWGGPSVKARAWASGLEQREDGLWPRFDLDVVERVLRCALRGDHWAQWESIRAPTLLVKGEHGPIPRAYFDEMLGRAGHASLIEVPRAGHDVHIEAPDAWRRVLEDFLRHLPG